jgi:hypothetical protein
MIVYVVIETDPVSETLRLLNILNLVDNIQLNIFVINHPLS